MLSTIRPLGQLALGLAAIIGSAAGAQNFTTDPNGSGNTAVFPAPEGGCGAVTVTQSTTQNIVSLNSVACPADNDQYFRAFNMGAFPAGFNACEVQFGVETATSMGGSQPIIVNVYANTGAAFPGGTAALLGTANATVNDGAMTIISTPLTAAVPPGAEMVVEIVANDTTNGTTFFIGSNPDGQSGPSYLQSAGCGATTPTPTGTLGFPNMHVVMNVIGDPVPTDADVSIIKGVTAPSPLVVGSTVNYVLTASNNGPGDAENVVVTDSLPANLTFATNDCSAAVAGQDITWTIGTLANGGNAVCNISATVNTFGPIDNTANIATTTNDPTPGNNTSTASLAGVPFPADVAISLTSNAPAGAFAVGTQFNYTVTGSNAGPGDANGLTFSLTLSGKVSFVSSNCGAAAAGNVVSWTVPTLAVGATTSCDITVSVVAPGDLLSSASVTTTSDDPNLVNNFAQLVVGFVATQVPTLSQLGLLLLGLILAGAAVVVIRR